MDNKFHKWSATQTNQFQNSTKIILTQSHNFQTRYTQDIRNSTIKQQDYNYMKSHEGRLIKIRYNTCLKEDTSPRTWSFCDLDGKLRIKSILVVFYVRWTDI